MMNKEAKHFLIENLAIIVVLALCVLGVLKYIDYRLDNLKTELEDSKNSLSLFEADTQNKIKELGEILSSTLTEEQKKNNHLKEQLSEITDTVDELEKLSATDRELLKKYSKTYFLNEHYVPISLSAIDDKYRAGGGTNFQIHSDVVPFLEDMLDEAEEDGLELRVLSAYRSFNTQATLKANYTVTYGSGANKFSADQGYSEHQLGTTLDLTTVATKGALNGFEKTPEYAWLKENAHKYGFVLSYPEGNSYYKFEPWHWRFVGVDLAKRLNREGIYFYDMDQRVIDSYLSKIFE